MFIKCPSFWYILWILFVFVIVHFLRGSTLLPVTLFSFENYTAFRFRATNRAIFPIRVSLSTVIVRSIWRISFRVLLLWLKNNRKALWYIKSNYQMMFHYHTELMTWLNKSIEWKLKVNGKKMMISLEARLFCGVYLLFLYPALPWKLHLHPLYFLPLRLMLFYLLFLLTCLIVE